MKVFKSSNKYNPRTSPTKIMLKSSNFDRVRNPSWHGERVVRPNSKDLALLLFLKQSLKLICAYQFDFQETVSAAPYGDTKKYPLRWDHPIMSWCK